MVNASILFLCIEIIKCSKHVSKFMVEQGGLMISTMVLILGGGSKIYQNS